MRNQLPDCVPYDRMMKEIPILVYTELRCGICGEPVGQVSMCYDCGHKCCKYCMMQCAHPDCDEYICIECGEKQDDLCRQHHQEQKHGL